MKKIIATVLCTAMALSLAACGAKEEQTAQVVESKVVIVEGEDALESEAEAESTTPAIGEVTADDGLDCDLTGLTFAFIYQDLETEFWVEAYNWAMKNMEASGAEVIEYNAKQDVNKQLEYINDAVAQAVDAILIVPQDSDSAVACAQAANDGGVPIAFVNRVPSDMDSIKAIACQADNEGIAQGAMEYVLAQASERYDTINVIDMVGDLGDVNAIAREAGFQNAIAGCDKIGEVYTVSTQWDANVALSNLQTVLQETTDIQVLCCGSDFLYPQIESALEEVGLWKSVDEEGHIYMCAVDGDSGAAALMDEGYVDATGVQDVYNECRLCIEALASAIADGDTQPSELLVDPGVAQTRESMKTDRSAMWGFQVLDAK